MSRKKQKHKSIFGNFYSPYMTDEKKNMDAWYYDGYKNDPDKRMVIGDQVFSKIIFRCEFYRGEPYSLEVFIDPPETLRIGDVLVDEKGNEYTLKSVEMIRFTTIPEWYPRIAPLVISGSTYDIGAYLAKKTNTEETVNEI